MPEALALALPSTFHPLASMVVIDDTDMAPQDFDQEIVPLHSLPDELLLHTLWFLDIPDLFAISRVGSNQV